MDSWFRPALLYPRRNSSRMWRSCLFQRWARAGRPTNTKADRAHGHLSHEKLNAPPTQLHRKVCARKQTRPAPRTAENFQRHQPEHSREKSTRNHGATTSRHAARDTTSVATKRHCFEMILDRKSVV